MASAEGGYKTPTDYIQHHLSFWTQPVSDGPDGHGPCGFARSMSFGLGILGTGAAVARCARGMTAGVPGKRQAFIELIFDFIDDQVVSIFHGDRHKFIAPLALTVGLWILLMNAMDFIPIDWIAGLAKMPSAPAEFRPVATADVNTTFALAIGVWGMTIYYAIKVKGLGGWIKELFGEPFGKNPLLWPGQLPVQPDRVPVQAAVSLPAAVRQHVRRRSYLPAALGLGSDRHRRHRFRMDPQSRLGDLPHSDRVPAGIHFHDADRGVPVHGS